MYKIEAAHNQQQQSVSIYIVYKSNCKLNKSNQYIASETSDEEEEESEIIVVYSRISIKRQQQK